MKDTVSFYLAFILSSSRVNPFKKSFPGIYLFLNQPCTSGKADHHQRTHWIQDSDSLKNDFMNQP